MSEASPLPHALTIDAEDWAALMCMYSGRSIPVSDQFASTVHSAVDLLDEYSVQATFFTVAQHAQEKPDLVREIAARGHEVASHAWTHLTVKAFSPEAFCNDITRSVRTLEDLTGKPVRGHRSPLFSLMPEHVWALEAMASAGLEYDSSVATLPWHRAGFDIPDHPFIFRLPSGAEIIEFPVPARKVGPITVRFIGGRGARLAPASLSVRHVREREASGHPAMIYVHNYEIIPDGLAKYIPRSMGLKRVPIALAGLAFQLGVGRLHRLVRTLLSEFAWAPAVEVIRSLREAGRLPVYEFPTDVLGGRAEV